MAKILVVEDDKELGESYKDWLGQEKHIVEVVDDGEEAILRLKNYQYDIIILDWNLPKFSGPEICQQYRSHSGTTPILMITGKDLPEDKVSGLDSGADDYLTKPFNLQELSSRIRALLRRQPLVVSTALTIGSLELDSHKRIVRKNGQEIALLPREFALLEFFMRHPGETFSPETLLNRLWSSESDSTIYTVYTYIKTLRRKIAGGDEKSSIVNVHGVGYKLEA
ncbi:MAG: response regulator transcription factor [Candidatus Obscuribacterales bacterium]|jgi:DNA-binding response OmpR family regulator|nr:response regulator transcription factor [Candidatus Obscuribacterales bacterium]